MGIHDVLQARAVASKYPGRWAWLMGRRRTIRTVAALLVGVLLGLTISGIGPTIAIVQATEPSVSVKLKNYLGNPTSVRVTIRGKYRIADDPGTELVEGIAYEVRIDQGSLVLLRAGKPIKNYGSAFTAQPIQYGTNNVIYINGFPYLGEMRFEVESGRYVRPVNRLLLEDYLKGVVPREMPRTWPLEALKAQAVAARTYASRYLGKTIDDTQTYQVYGGYVWSGADYQKSNRAVDETRGQVLRYKGQLISAVYSASNGGHTESNAAEWGGDPLPYLPAKPDPYDPKLPWSVKIRKVQIDLKGKDLAYPEKWWSDAREADQLITANIKTWIKKNVAAFSAADLKITAIPHVSVRSEKTPGGRRLYGSITVEFFAKDASGYRIGQDGKLERFQLQLGTVRASALNVREQPSTQSRILGKLGNGARAVILGRTGDWYRIAYGKGFAYVFAQYVRPYYSIRTVRDMIGSSLVRTRLIDAVHDRGSTFEITGRGYGHGVGMSQWGAKVMADKGYSYRKILEFYYPGAVVSGDVTPPGITGVTVSPNPFTVDGKSRQTLRFTLGEDARVTIRVLDSKGTPRATLLSQASLGMGNRSVSWDGAKLPTGRYTIVIEAVDAANNRSRGSRTVDLVNRIPQPSKASGTPAGGGQTGTVRVQTRLNVRSGPGLHYKILGRLTNGTKVQILGKSGRWYHIRFGKLIGYVYDSYIQLKTSQQKSSTAKAYYVGGGLYRTPNEALAAAKKFTKLTGYKMYVARHPSLNGYWVQSGRIADYARAQDLARKWARFGLKYVISASN